MVQLEPPGYVDSVPRKGRLELCQGYEHIGLYMVKVKQCACERNVAVTTMFNEFDAHVRTEAQTTEANTGITNLHAFQIKSTQAGIMPIILVTFDQILL